MDFSGLKDFMPQIIATLITMAALPVFKYASHKLTKKYGALAHMSKPRIRQVRYVIAVMLNVLFILMLMIIWSVRPHNILLGFSSVFAIIGVALFAQWSVLSNITAGLIMFFSASYRVGNKIQFLDKDMAVTATIEIIGTFYTHIRTEEDELIVIPNNLFLQKVVAIKKH